MIRPPPSSPLFPHTPLFRSGRHRRLGEKTQRPQRKGVGPRGNKDAAAATRQPIPPPLPLVVRRGLQRGGQGRRLGAQDPGVERGSRRAPTKAGLARGADELGEGMGQGGRSARLGEVYAPQGLSGAAEKVGSGADDSLDRPKQEDEQGLREVV